VASLKTVMDTILACVCDALSEADRPPCSCHPTIGPPVIGLCCECDEEGSTGDLTISFEDRYPAAPDTLQRVQRVYPCRRGTEAVDLLLVLTRCFPRVDDSGNMPTENELKEASDDLHDDADVIWRAINCCPGIRLMWRGLAVDSMPEAGCSAIAARITVEVT
jgi:hypothetical protein